MRKVLVLICSMTIFYRSDAMDQKGKLTEATPVKAKKTRRKKGRTLSYIGVAALGAAASTAANAFGLSVEATGHLNGLLNLILECI